MIKLKDLITETVDEKVLRLSKDGASKPFLKDFDRVFKKKSKEFGYGKLDKKTQTLNVQVSEPAGFDKPIKREKITGMEIDYQFDEGVNPGSKSYKYSLDDFKKDLKKFRGYKIKQKLPVIFQLTKGDFVYSIAYIDGLSGTFVIASTRK